ncbi:MAG: DUF488 domain-containing protein [Acidobacteriaceae bacterium]
MLTIGHSTLELEAFLVALNANACTTLVDVRRYPGSRRYPQFGQERLFTALGERGISAVWREGLGGRRKVVPDSINVAWRNESFRGYADYMQTTEFSEQIDWLTNRADLNTTVVMCAEAVPWRCHRSLIGDAVLARGQVVEDIFVSPEGRTTRKPHSLTKFARVDGTRVWYPQEDSLFG